MAVRRALLERIEHIIQRDQHTSATLAHCLGMTLPRASNLLHGHIARFNSETLIDVLARLGVSVEVTVVEEKRYHRWNVVPARDGWSLPPHFAPRFLAPVLDPLSTPAPEAGCGAKPEAGAGAVSEP